jgi:exodeoxyribonuclease VII large subunit
MSSLSKTPLSISSLYAELSTVISSAFPRSRELWVKGEIQKVSDYFHKSGHCYIDLIDPDYPDPAKAPVLRVKCWKQTWSVLRSRLSQEGIELADGMNVIISGYIDFYQVKGEVSLILESIDLESLLGRLALERKRLIEALSKEGLLELNKSIPIPPVPLKVGLVASPGTEGYSDFVGQLMISGYGFHVVVAPTQVQGSSASKLVVAALDALAGCELDVAVIVRGGGSKADLLTFDDASVARRVATMPVPVLAGIGHTGDQSVVDLVANSSFITPTSCGRWLVEAVDAYMEYVQSSAGNISFLAVESITHVENYFATLSGRISAGGSRALDDQARIVTGIASKLTSQALIHLVREREALKHISKQLSDSATRAISSNATNLDNARRLALAYDPIHQIERGYSITWVRDGEGKRIMRSIQDAGIGETLITRLGDGDIQSEVSSPGDTLSFSGIALRSEVSLHGEDK